MEWTDVLKVGLVVLGSLGGGGAVVLYLSGWLGNVWATRIQQEERAKHERALLAFQQELTSELEARKEQVQRELQALQASTEKELSELKERSDAALKRLESELTVNRYIHSLQFNREFELYGELWPKLVELRNKIRALRPVVDVVDRNESEEDRKKRRNSEFIKSYESFFSLGYMSEPFFPKAVYSRILTLRTLVQKEALHYKRGEDQRTGFDEKYWKDAEANAEAIMKAVDEVCEAIRERMGLLELPGLGSKN